MAVHNLPRLQLRQVGDRADSRLWNEYIHRYHYLGFAALPGAQLRYWVYAGERQVALLGFSAAAWQCAPRDQFIGWTHGQRQKNLHLVINNARFLILPWVGSENLASKVLGLAARQLPQDWQRRYGFRPMLLETFVEKTATPVRVTERLTGVMLAKPRGEVSLALPASRVFLSRTCGFILWGKP